MSVLSDQFTIISGRLTALKVRANNLDNDALALDASIKALKAAGSVTAQAEVTRLGLEAGHLRDRARVNRTDIALIEVALSVIQLEVKKLVTPPAAADPITGFGPSFGQS